MPDRVRAQFEGAAVFGASLAMGEITADAGRITQGNFNNYPVARMKEAPRKIDVAIVDSKERHAGAGEPRAPVIAPAIAAAISRPPASGSANCPSSGRSWSGKGRKFPDRESGIVADHWWACIV
jgi:hypothetical protein